MATGPAPVGSGQHVSARLASHNRPGRNVANTMAMTTGDELTGSLAGRLAGRPAPVTNADLCCSLPFD